jgi:hypothetical protein
MKTKLLFFLFFMLAVMQPGFGQCPPNCSEEDRRAKLADQMVMEEAAERRQTEGAEDMLEFIKTAGTALLTIWDARKQDAEANRLKMKCIEGDCQNSPSIQALYHMKIPYLYKGEFKQGAKNGNGEMYVILNNKPILLEMGTYSNNLQSGLGYKKDWTVYTTQGVMESRSELRFSGKYYFGEFRAGLRDGYGGFYGSDSLPLYEGEWKNGFYSGQGREYGPGGKLQYGGAFQAGARNGLGKSYFPNGNVQFDGNWLNGRVNGSAKEYYANGQLKLSGNFVEGRPNGEVQLFDEKGKIKFEGSLFRGTEGGEGKTYLADGSVFEGNWRTIGWGFKESILQGKVINAEGRVTNRYRVYSLHGDIAKMMRGIVLLEVGVLGGVGPRYAGAKRNVAPWEFLPYNFDGRVHLVGPRFLKWNRLFAHAYLNSRVHSIGSASDSIYISGAALADQTGPTNYHRLMLNDAPTTVPLGLITKEAGAGLSAYFPLDDEVSFDAGVGAAFWQRSNLRIGKEVMTYDTLNVGGLVFNKVLQFKDLDYYLELGFRVGYFRLGMRSYLRSPVSPNRNLPLFVADGAGYSQYFVGNRKLSLKPSVSLSFQVNLGQLGDRSHLVHEYKLNGYE